MKCWSLKGGDLEQQIPFNMRSSTYSGLCIQVLRYIQWSLNIGSSVHTVASHYRFYCTYSGLSIPFLLFQYFVWCNYKRCSQFLFCFRQRRCHCMWCGATHDGDCGSRGCLAHGDNCAQNKTGLLKVSAVFVHVYTQVQLNTHLSTHIHIYTHRYI